MQESCCEGNGHCHFSFDIPHNQLYFSQLRTRTKFKADCVSKKSFRTLETLGPTYPPAEKATLSCTENLQLSCHNSNIFCQILKFLKTLKFGVGVVCELRHPFLFGILLKQLIENWPSSACPTPTRV